MNLAKKTIKFDRIDMADKSLRYSDGRYDRDALGRSISALGLLNPVIVAKKGSYYQIITGFRRLEVAALLGLDSVPVYIINYEASLKELLKLSVQENQATRTLNLFEKATLLLKLQNANIPKKEIAELFMPLIGLPPSVQRMEELLTLVQLPHPLVEYVLSKHLPVRRFRHLKGLPVSSLAFFAMLVQRLNPAATTFEQVTKQIVEVAQRDGCSVDEVVTAHGLSEIAANDSMDNARRLRVLREMVFALRFPVLATENQRIERELKSFDLPSCLRINWDKSLEGEYLEVKAILRTEDDFEDSIICLERFKSDQVLKKSIQKLP